MMHFRQACGVRVVPTHPPGHLFVAFECFAAVHLHQRTPRPIGASSNFFVVLPKSWPPRECGGRVRVGGANISFDSQKVGRM